MAEDREERAGLASAVAHELRTPLAAVRGAARALLDGAPDDEARRRLLAVILDATAQAERLAEDLLTAGRLDAGALPVVTEAVHLHEIAEAVAESAKLAGAGASIVVRAPRELRASADAGRVRQILANLVANAAEHAPSDSEVSIEARREGRLVEVAVSDSGPGVPPDERERIFEPYVRLRERPAGAGLGLYLARGLARAMGGELTYEPGGAGGSTFVLRLPGA